MKTKIVLSGLLFSNLLYAGSWDDILQSIEGENQTLKDDGSNHTTTFYNATITYNVTNNDGTSGNFSGSDVANITIKTGNKTISTNGNLSESELEDWAKDNANDIVSAVFGGDPVSSLSGQNSSTLSSVTINQTLQSTINSSTSSETKEDNKNGFSTGSSFRSKVIMNSESSTIKDDGVDITASSGLLTYAKDLEDSNKSIGFLVSYRYTDSADKYSSKTGTVSIAPYYNIKTKLSPEIELNTAFNILTNLVYMESAIFPDGAGYLEYGAGFAIMPKYHINDNFTLNANLAYQYQEKYIPDSAVPDGAEWLSDAINNLKALQNINYGIGLDYNINEKWNVNTNILQVKQLETEDLKEGRDTSTYYAASSTYELEKWTLGAGYKIVADVQDYEESTYMLTASYKW